MSAGKMALRSQEENVDEKPQDYSVKSEPTTPLMACEYQIAIEDNNSVILPPREESETQKPTYVLVREIFIRVLAGIYFICFLGHFNQDVSLLGQHGMWPANVYLSSVIKELSNGSWDSSGNVPGLFSVLPICDACIVMLSLAGMIISALIALTGIVGCGTCITLWLMQYSLVSLLADLPKHNSDLLLLEVGFLAIFMFSPFLVFERQGKEWKVPLISRWAIRFLLYRVMFCAGVSKIRGSVHWLDGTAFKYLLQSIVLPNPITHYLFNVLNIHPAINVAATNSLIFVECVASIFLVMPIRSCRIFGGVMALVYSLFFNFVGNFGCFYLLLACCSIFCFDDAVIKSICRNPFKKEKKAFDFISHDGSVETLPETEEEDDCLDKESEVDEGLTIKFVRALTYESKKNCLRELLFSKAAFGMENEDERHRRIQEVIQAAIISAITLMTLNMIISRSNLGIKACVIFCLAGLMEVQCDAIGSQSAYYKVSGVLFSLHIWLVLEMMANGVGVWNLWLWVAITELQIGLCRTVSRLNRTTKMLMQSIVLLSGLYYSLPLVVRSINHPRTDVGFKAPFGIVNAYEGFGDLAAERHEIVIQGTFDTVVNRSTRWRTYEFYGVPGDVNKRPVFVPGYNYELNNLLHDVLNRDLVYHSKAVPAFMLELIRALLQNKEQINRLMSFNPFKKKAPTYVRVMQYTYKFAGPGEKTWYTREEDKQIIPPLTLERVAQHKAEKHMEQKDVRAEHFAKGPNEPAQNGGKIMHIVHEMPPASNIRGVPLEMAGNFVRTAPVTGSLMLTRL